MESEIRPAMGIGNIIRKHLRGTAAIAAAVEALDELETDGRDKLAALRGGINLQPPPRLGDA